MRLGTSLEQGPWGSRLTPLQQVWEQGPLGAQPHAAPRFGQFWAVSAACQGQTEVLMESRAGQAEGRGVRRGQRAAEAGALPPPSP